MKAIFTALVLSVFSVAALAANPATNSPEDKTKPAKRYSGSAPVDLSRGMPFNNGTYGSPNAEYEALTTQGYLAPGVRATPYTYQQRGEFVERVKALFIIYEEAIENLSQNKDQRPEVKAYRENQRSELQKRLDAAKEAVEAADGANESEWSGAQDKARAAFGSLQSLLVRNNTQY